MKWDELSREPCSLARSVAVIGDRWTLLILRDCFLGVRRFEAFQERLGISRTIIADRLKVLTDEGVLEKFDMSLDEAQTLIMTARVMLGWVDPTELEAAEDADEGEADEEAEA